MWDDLSRFVVGPGGWTTTKSGIIIPKTEEAPKANSEPSTVEANDDAPTSATVGNEAPAPAIVSSEATAETNGDRTKEGIDQTDNHDESGELSIEEAEDIIRKDEENSNNTAKSISEAEASEKPPEFNVVEFIQSTDKAEDFKKEDSGYFTFLISAEQGVAVERDQAVEYYKAEMGKAKTDEDLWKMKRMEGEMLISKDFTEEEKAEVKSFSESPEIRSKMINYEIRKNKKLLKKAEDAVARCADECAQYDSMNIVSKFLNRDKIHDARYRLENAIKKKETIQDDIYKLEAELYEIDSQNESDSGRIVRIERDEPTEEFESAA